MAFVGQTPQATVQYTAAIGPRPVTGEPMEADMITSAAIGAAAALAINPVVGLVAMTGWMAFGPKKKVRAKAQTQGG